MRNVKLGAVAALAMSVMACATAPKTASERRDLEARADATLATMRSRDPGLQPVLDTAAGYAVFPEIGKGGMVAGAAYGRGVLYEGGRRTGFVELNQASIGAQAGGQTFSELMVFRDRVQLDQLKAGTYSVGANASAVALQSGAAAAAEFRDGVAVFVLPRGGLMAEVTISGQKINYQPLGG